MNRTCFAALSLVAILAAPSALAKPDKSKPEKGRPERHQGAADHAPQEKAQAAARLGDRERDIVQGYFSDPKRCPPGLAKKNNGCMPPGLAKKRYEVGQRLGDDVEIRRVPRSLRDLLPALPDGQGYRFVDNDLGVVELSTMVLIEALAL